MRDIGANLASSRFSGDLPGILERAWAAGISAIDITGVSLPSSSRALEIALSDSRLFFTAGVHPHEAKSWLASSESAIADLLSSPKASMAGEMGLDFFRMLSTRQEQEIAFEAQLEIAASAGKPLFLHCRDAHSDFLRILDRQRSLPPAIVHCFTGTASEAKAYLERGFFIGITGWITDTARASSLRNALREIPPERILLETDAPFLPPLNRPGAHRRDRNEPAYLPFVAEAVSQAIGCDPAFLLERVSDSMSRLFASGGPAGSLSVSDGGRGGTRTLTPCGAGT